MGIKVEDIFYTYLPKTPFQSEALKGVSCNITEKLFTAIVGETGSGKSTLVQMFNGLILPTSGEVHVDEFVVTPKKRHNSKNSELRKHVGLVFQFPEYQLFEETVEKDVAFGLMNFKVPQEEALLKAQATLLSLGLNESYFKKSPLELSGGEKRKVAIAGILAIDPDILVLDEPTAALDPLGVQELMTLLIKLKNKGKTIILITHDMNLVLKYADKIVVLNKGKIQFAGKPLDFFINFPNDFSLEIPPLYELAVKLKNKGMNLDIERIKSTDDLIDQILRNKK